MKLNYLTKQIKAITRFTVTTAICLSAIAFVWQGGFLSDNSANASVHSSVYSSNLIAAGMGREVKDKAMEDAGATKGFIRDAARTQNAVDETKDAVKGTVNNIKDVFN
ncbi:MAG: hypothetical protein AAF208_06955 [Cyanobacteria bacterium P01_A01_bin.45]